MTTKPTRKVTLTPSLADLLFTTVFLLLFFTNTSRLLGDGDTGYHIRAGEYILRTRSVPTFDLFSYHTPPIPWTAHEWLSEVLMAAIHSRFGLTGVDAFFAALLALTIALLFRLQRSYRADILLTILITISALAAFKVHWLARPHVFSFLFMVVYHDLLEYWRREQGTRLALLPPLMLLWVNLHGGYLGGFLLLGAYLVGTLVKTWWAKGAERRVQWGKVGQLVFTTAVSLAACLLNPQGYRILLFPFRLVGDTYIMDHISEFMSVDFHQFAPFKYLLLLLIALFAMGRRRMEVTELVLVLLFTNMALYSARYIALFALVTAPIMTRQAGELGELREGRMAAFFRKRSENIMGIDARARGHLWPMMALCLVVAATCSGMVRHGFDEKTKAVRAAEFLLKEKISGNMFDNDEIGDYLIYRTYPTYKVFFDGRSDMYGSTFMKEYYQVIKFQPGWEKILDKYRVTWIIFDTDSDFARFLLKSKEWPLIYSDNVASIFVKDVLQNQELIRKYRLVRPASYRTETEPAPTQREL
ncbi:hypothetical protein [Geomonas sp.]|uniref:hypothetical protein n=1 Tax=Geomonas sp. TaxID=2651584 RepID=UPI002B4834A3|nr:hypothetical protein [Geomonas sp.]HJV35010.1 hypothetical protein [Geomonas sp.]